MEYIFSRNTNKEKMYSENLREKKSIMIEAR